MDEVALLVTLGPPALLLPGPLLAVHRLRVFVRLLCRMGKAGTRGDLVALTTLLLIAGEIVCCKVQ
jgi:hypothetical protein